MRKIFLIGINSRYSHSNLAIRYLKSYVKDLSYEIKILELSINHRFDLFKEKILDKNPDVISLSVYIWNSAIIKSYIPKIKQHLPDSIIVLGGPEVSYNPNEWLDLFPMIDFIVAGPGEAGFRHLLESGFQWNTKIINIKNPHFSKIPSAYDAEFDDSDDMRNRYVYYESSRGCAFKCAYCLSSRGDMVLEYRDTDTVYRELDKILSYRPKFVKFVDRTFNSSGDHCGKIWRYCMDNYSENDTVFHFEIHPGLVKSIDLELLSECRKGMFQFEIGIQSINPRSLEEVRRPFKFEDISDKIKQIISLNKIHVHLDIIAGLPHDSIDWIRTGVDACIGFWPDHLQLGILKVLPGTDMREYALKNSYVYNKEAPYEVISNPWLSMAEMQIIEAVAFYLDRIYNTMRFKNTLKRLITLYGSGFGFFEDISGISHKKGINSLTRDHADVTSVLEVCINSRAEFDSELLLDWLAWDWIQTDRSGVLRHQFLRDRLRAQEKTAKRKNINTGIINKPRADGILQDGRFSFVPKSDAFLKQLEGINGSIL
jgi:radical SAM superfamily enzyme YgiQ (UPF0313 family)